MSRIPVAPQAPMLVDTYHDGMRTLQDRYDTRRLADRLDERLGRSAFTPEDRAFIESRPLFFLASADARGRPDCSYKGGEPGFVRVTADDELAFPSYDGNGMFRSLGNLLVNQAVGLLFIDFESPRRLRVNGRASIADDDPLQRDLVGAQMVVYSEATELLDVQKKLSSKSGHMSCRVGAGEAALKGHPLLMGVSQPSVRH